MKILDFGIAKFYGSSEGASGTSETEQRHLTTVGKVLGTPVYMSPEQRTRPLSDGDLLRIGRWGPNGDGSGRAPGPSLAAVRRAPSPAPHPDPCAAIRARRRA